MPKYKIDVDVQVKVWQTVRLVVEARDQTALEMGNYVIENHTGDVETHWDTEEEVDVDYNTIRLVSELPEEITNA